MILVVVKYATLASEDGRLAHSMCLAPLLTLVTSLIFMSHMDPEKPSQNRRLIVYSMLLMQILYWGVEIATSWLETCLPQDTLQKSHNASSSQQHLAAPESPRFTRRQILALSFTISFYLISEIEHWAPLLFGYPTGKRIPRWPDIQYAFTFFDHLDWYARLCPSDIGRIPVDHTKPTVWSKLNMRFLLSGHILDVFGFATLLWMYWCLQRIFNPGLDFDLTMGYDTIFTSRNGWGRAANIALMRPARVLHAAVVWGTIERCVLFVERRRKEARERKEKDHSSLVGNPRSGKA
ncbi:hypothetical protein J1614_009070 [Plenodomus biglobosus]|nr:hypothetical protein J1614_009070 [Plenodomus biglobosus]